MENRHRQPYLALNRIGMVLARTTGIPLGIEQLRRSRSEGFTLKAQMGNFLQGMGKELALPITTRVANDPARDLWEQIQDRQNNTLYHFYMIDFVTTGLLDSMGILGAVDGKLSLLAVLAGLHIIKNLTFQSGIEMQMVS